MSRAGSGPRGGCAPIGAVARTARANFLPAHALAVGPRTYSTRRSGVGERGDLAPDVLERVGIAGYGGLKLLMGGGIPRGGGGGGAPRGGGGKPPIRGGH